MPDLPPDRPDGATIFERHAAAWRFVAVFLPAALGGSLAGDLAEQHGVTGVARHAVAAVVVVALMLGLLCIWHRVLAWLAARRSARPTV